MFSFAGCLGNLFHDPPCVSQKVWSYSVHSTPADCYVGLLSPRAAERGATMATMKKHYANIVELERNRLLSPGALKLYNAIVFLKHMALRLLYALYARDDFNTQSIQGQKILRGLLDVLPDNKGVEEAHHFVRKEQKHNPNTRLSHCHVQDCVNNSRVLEARQIPHASAVGRVEFMRSYPSSNHRYVGRKHYSWRHSLPRDWTTILGRKTWATTSEDVYRTSAAAWAWLHSWCDNRTCAIDASLWSRLTPVAMILHHVPSDSFMVGLGHFSWAALVWPLDVLCRTDDEAILFGFDAGAEARWAFVTNVDDYCVFDWEAYREDVGIVLRVIGTEMGLVKYAVYSNPCGLNFEDLCRMAQHFDLPVGCQNTRHEILEAVATHLWPADPNTVTYVMSLLPNPKSESLLADDPIVEACYGDLLPDDKLEFKSMGDQIEKKRRGKRLITFNNARRAYAKAKPKGKARAKAKPPPPRPPPGVPAVPAEPPLGAAPPGQPPPAPGPPADAAAAGIPPVPPVFADRLSRGSRQISFGSMFTLAATGPLASPTSWTVTCLLHHSEGLRCNKNLTISHGMSEDEAVLRIKRWCIEGQGIEDGLGARDTHMNTILPRIFPVDELKSHAEYERMLFYP